MAPPGRSALDLIALPQLMARSSGSSRIVIGLIDGPVAIDHPDLMAENVRQISSATNAACHDPTSLACLHGTIVAGILLARRSSSAPGICPDCTLLVRPIFHEHRRTPVPTATAEELAKAIVECVDGGARLINLSVALIPPSFGDLVTALHSALDYAASRGAITVAAAGNQSSVGDSGISSHPGVVGVAAYGLDGRPMYSTNLAHSIGRRGLGAPGEGVVGLGGYGERTVKFVGTSIAAPLVTGTIALLRAEFPSATGAEVVAAMTVTAGSRRSLLPPLLNAAAAYDFLSRAR